MNLFLTPAIREAAHAYDVHIEERARFGVSEPRAIAIESPAEIRSGVYDVDLIGAFSYLGSYKDMALSNALHINVIGRFCSIAGNLIAGQPEHPVDFLSSSPLFYGRFEWAQAKAFHAENHAAVARANALFTERNDATLGKIQIGNDVWIGDGVFIRRGVEIGDGAIIAARSFVNRDVPPYAIVAGTPARVIRYRFEQPVIDALLDLQWWRYGLSALHGVDFTDVGLALRTIMHNIESGRAQPYNAPVLQISPDTMDVFRVDPETGTVTGA